MKTLCIRELATCLVAIFALASALAAQRDALHVSVQMPDGTPCANAAIRVLRYEGKDANYTNLDLVDGAQFRRVLEAKTGRSGTAAVHITTAIPHRIEVDVEPFAIEVRRNAFAGETLTIKLRKGAVVSGKVVRDDGLAVHDAEVELVYGSRRTKRLLMTDSAGAFRFERVMPVPIILQVNSSLGTVPRWIDVEPVSGENFETEIKITKGLRLIGSLHDADTGAPIVGGEVGFNWTFDKAVQTDRKGTFSMQGIGGPYGNDYFARAPGYLRLRIPKPTETEGPIERNLSLQRGNTLRGRVLGVDGKPARDCYVAVVGMMLVDRTQPTTWQSCRTDASGRFTIAGVNAALNPGLLVRDDKHATLFLPIEDFGTADKPTTLPDVVLRPRRILSGTVTDDGKVLAGATLALTGTHRDAAPQLHRPGDILKSYLAERTVKTDSLGRFFFADLTAGSYTLNFEGESIPVEVDAGRDPEPLKLER